MVNPVSKIKKGAYRQWAPSDCQPYYPGGRGHPGDTTGSSCLVLEGRVKGHLIQSTLGQGSWEHDLKVGSTQGLGLDPLRPSTSFSHSLGPLAEHRTGELLRGILGGLCFVSPCLCSFLLGFPQAPHIVVDSLGTLYSQTGKSPQHGRQLWFMTINW